MNKKWDVMKLMLVVWAGVALLLLVPVTLFLQGSFPIFTAIWLTVPFVVVLRTPDAGRVGIRRIAWRSLLITAGTNLLLLILLSLVVEPWSHAYQALVRASLTGTPPDTTFAWLIRYQGAGGWIGLFLFSGLVTIFGEELFFRGWLLQTLQRRLRPGLAVVIQAVLFTLPQLLAAFVLAPLQGTIYAIVYSFIGVGLIGGWAAYRTQSIWPSLVSATIWNLVMVAWLI